jgi:hypothetical protein
MCRILFINSSGNSLQAQRLRYNSLSAFIVESFPFIHKTKAMV